MASFLPLLLLLLLPLSTTTTTTTSTSTSDPTPIGHYCRPFSTLHLQLNHSQLLHDVADEASISGFATSSILSIPVYTLAQCRGDINSKDCSTCVHAAANVLPQLCPPNTFDGRVWFDYCIMRFTNYSFFGQVDATYFINYANIDNATDPVEFMNKTSELMSHVSGAATEPGNAGLGRGEYKFEPQITIYGLAQCTEDLEPMPCAQCLSLAVAKFRDYCQFKQGCQVLFSSCWARYEIYPFFFPLDGNATTTLHHSVVAQVNT
ncbi:Gnk2-homologous domain-containing protein [Dioscorea alata]|uniref:Gnk2-homologous domain-containing protein n=1 Tax=Dioscorea alata TaxID=55571 RepID=A0ACB7V3P3_DIOAL|nr:Gnk2-homologous domain-containing protein [Dioscorea alata]